MIIKPRAIAAASKQSGSDPRPAVPSPLSATKSRTIYLAPPIRFSGAMTALTRRRRDHGLHREAWDIHWGDVRVGTIGQVNGTEGRMIWQWTCGFHPGCEPRERTRGTCVTFDEARAAFERQWRLLQPRVTDEMMDEWRRNEAWTAWKYLMWDRGCLMPAQTTNGFSHCFCGAEITTKSVPDHVYSEHMDRSKRQLEWEH